MSDILVLCCSACDEPVVTTEERGSYCLHCGFAPSMQDTYFRPTKRPTKPAKKSEHHCNHNPSQLEWGGFGWAIEDCTEHDDGSFWVDNGEYASRVNYCPFCGASAPKQMEIRSST